MRYYQQNDYGFTREISMERYWLLARRKDARTKFCTGADGRVSARYVKLNTAAL